MGGQSARRSDATVRHIGERFRVGFDDAAIGMSVTRLDGRYLRVNRAFCALVGHDEQTLLQMRLQDLTHPDDVDGTDHQIASAMERGEATVSVDKRYVHAEGHVIDVRVNTAFMRDDDGTPRYFFTQVQDVSKLVAAQRLARDGQRRLERIIASATAGYVEFDPYGAVVEWNAAAEAIFGWTRDEALGRSLADLIAPDEHRAVYEEKVRQYREEFEGRVAESVEAVLLNRDGHRIPVEATFWTVDDGDDRSVHAFFRDISERRRTEEAMQASTRALAEAEQRWRLTLDNAPTGIALVGLDSRMIRVNAALCRILGFSEGELLERTFLGITHPDDLEVSRDRLARMLAGEFDHFVLEKRYRHADGHTVWVNVSVGMVRDSGGEPLHAIVHVEDVTDRRAQTEQLQDLALRDALTGLANRARFLAELEDAVAARETRRPLAVLFLDLDGFKDVNDTYGHATGDQLLRLAGQRLEASVRTVDLAARLGGDEFAVLMPSLAHPGDIETVAARVLATLNEPYRLSSGTVALGVSVGAALADGATTSGTTLLTAADDAMYRAKRRGKNTYVVG